MKKIIYLFVGIFLFFSCTDKDSLIKFSEEKLLSAVKIPVDEVFAADFMTQSSNCLALISTRSDTMIYLYSLPDLKFIKNFGLKGKGPDEFLLPMFVKIPNNDLCLWGYSNSTLIRKLNIDSSTNVVLEKEYRLKKYENFNQMHIIRDSVFVYSTIPMDYKIKTYNLKNQKELGEIKIKVDKDNDNPNHYSNRGVIAANDSVIVYAYNYKKQIDIYDSKTLELKKTLVADYEYEKPTDDYREEIIYYLNVIPGKKYFYALYRGVRYKDAIENTRVIEVFDYNGIPIIRYKFDISPNLFFVDEENNIMYGYVDKYPDVLFKYNL